MAKLTDLRNRFEAAVTANAYIQTFISGPMADSERMLKRGYPALVLEIPFDSVISNYKKDPFERHTVNFFVIDEKLVKENEEDVWQKLTNMKDYGYDVIDYVISKATRPAYYDLVGDVRMRQAADPLRPGTVGVWFTLDISVNDCRNES